MPEVELTWLGQAGFVAGLGDVRRSTPFLSLHPARLGRSTPGAGDGRRVTPDAFNVPSTVSP
jgi:hypothetical protein